MSQRDFFHGLTPLVALTGLLVWSTGAGAQERSVIANQVEVSRTDAALHLEFSDGEQLDVTFDEGIARLGGEVLGEYEVGGDADQAWRALLSDVLSLSNGALAQALLGWQPDPASDSEDLALLMALDQSIDEAVAQAATASEQAEGRALARQELAGLLRRLARDENVAALGAALDDIDVDDIQVWVGEDVRIRRGESTEGSVLLIDGDLEVQGRVGGDVVVLDGTLELMDGSTVDGDVRLVDASVDDEGGQVRGSIVNVEREMRRSRSRLRAELRDEIREELGSRDWSNDRRRGRSYGFAGRTARAVGGLVESLISFAVLAMLALLVTRLGGDRVESVTRAVRENPARSAAVGFAGAFLIVPIYILGILILTVSIVGIPALLVWGPVFPLLVALGVFVGYLSVSHHVGRWVLSHDFTKLDWVDQNNADHVKLVGLAALFLPFAAAGIIQVLPFVGWIGGIIGGLGALAGLAAVIMGLGAVIITRGGRFADYGFEMDIGVNNTDWTSPADDFGVTVDDDIPDESQHWESVPADEEPGAGGAKEETGSSEDTSQTEDGA